MISNRLAGLACLLLPTFLSAQSAVNLKVDTGQVVREIDPKIYGQFLEHIYHSVNGGVWGEVVWNRSFEERLSPDDWRVRDGVLASPAGMANYSRFLIGGEAWRDYDFWADVHKTSAAGTVTVAARVSRAFGIGLRFEGTHAQLARMLGKDTTILGTAELALDPKRWYRVHFRCDGKRVQVSVDDKALFDMKVDAAASHGQASVSVNGATAEFRGFRAVALDHSVLLDELPSPARHWLALGAGELSLDAAQPANSSLSLKIAGGAGSGVGQAHLAVKRGDVLRGSILMRGEVLGGVSVRLMNNGFVLAQKSLPPPTKQWREYALEFDPVENAVDASLEIVSLGTAALWIDQVSLTSDSSVATGGFRPDLLKAAADLHPAVIRWPGGSFIGGYRWKDGIGPQGKRVGKPGWDEVDPLSFGIDEFIAFCRRVGAEPIVVINSGPRNAPNERPQYIQDARDLVEYCNGPATSKWGKVRTANGHREPYGVKYFELDNEIWSMKAGDYVDLVKQFAPAMKQVDGGIKIIACGSGQLGGHWAEGDIAVIENAAEFVDYLSIHHYENPDKYADGPANAEQYWEKLGAMIAKSRNPNLKLFMSEWNAQSTDWRTGLYAGGILNAFEKSGLVTMATPALFMRHVSAPAWDNAFINFDSGSWFGAPNYVVMKLYRDHFALQLLKVEGNASGLSVDAAKSADGKRVVVKLVNPSESAREVSMDLGGAFASGAASLDVVAPDKLDARNTLEYPHAVKVVAGKIAKDGDVVRFALPRWSVGVAEVNLPAGPATISKDVVLAQPDLLTTRGGKPVTDAQMWWKVRRPEILDSFESEEYGRPPSGKVAAQIVPHFRLDSIDRKALGGKAVRKQITISFAGVRNGPKLHLLLYVPLKGSGPVPAFLGLNFSGNHTVDADPGIDLPEVWVKDAGAATHSKVRAPESERGSAASEWEVEKLIDRGYALATIYYGDIEPDFDGGREFGVRQMFLRPKQAKRGEDWGAIGAWAWGLSRAMDCLQQDSDVNPRKIAVVGFSRLGKAAMWAGGLDQRFAMLISNESGQGGVGLLHRKAGERAEHLNHAFPHWFDANFREYIDHEEQLPVDGHMLLALAAPRPAYVGSAELDTDSDPKGEFLAAVEASRVYRLLGKQGLPATGMPAVDHAVMGDLGYHVRSGKHDFTAFDWDRYLEFADKWFGVER
jgi:alpha-N-arabinofuranosidase